MIDIGIKGIQTRYNIATFQEKKTIKINRAIGDIIALKKDGRNTE
jgi:hypothetical protein